MKLSKSVNMKCTHKMECRSCREVLQSCLEQSQFLHFFGNTGKFISDSCFTDVIFQAGMCTDGGLKGVISAKAYNNCWTIHKVVSKARDRLFCDAHVVLSPLNIKEDDKTI